MTMYLFVNMYILKTSTKAQPNQNSSTAHFEGLTHQLRTPCRYMRRIKLLRTVLAQTLRETVRSLSDFVGRGEEELQLKYGSHHPDIDLIPLDRCAQPERAGQASCCWTGEEVSVSLLGN